MTLAVLRSPGSVLASSTAVFCELWQKLVFSEKVVYSIGRLKQAP